MMPVAGSSIGRRRGAVALLSVAALMVLMAQCSGTPAALVCGPGTYLYVTVDPITHQPVSECVPCPAGTANPYAGANSIAECQACPSGSYSPTPASQGCQLCSAGYFSAVGSMNCTAAPIGTIVASPGGSLASCASGSSTVELASTACLSCPIPETCLGTGQCSFGSAGVLCGKCGEGYMNVGNACGTCPSVWWVTIVAGIAFQNIWDTVATMGKWNPIHGPVVIGFIGFIQMVHLQMLYHVPWPTWMRQESTWIAWTLGDLGGLHEPECGRPPFSWIASFWFIMVIAIMTLSNPPLKIWMMRRGLNPFARCSKKTVNPTVTESPMEPYCHAFAEEPVYEPMEDVKSEVARPIVDLMSFWSMMMVCMFVPLFRTFAFTIECVSSPLGELMVVDLTVQCSSGWAVFHRILSGVGGATVLALPLLIIWYHRGRRQNSKLLLSFAAPFTPEHPYMEAIIMLRKAVAVVLMVYVRSGFAQVAIHTGLTIALTVFVWRVRPWIPSTVIIGHRTISRDALNSMMLASLVFELFVCACSCVMLLTGETIWPTVGVISLFLKSACLLGFVILMVFGLLHAFPMCRRVAYDRVPLFKGSAPQPTYAGDI